MAIAAGRTRLRVWVQAQRNYERRWGLEWGRTDDEPREAYLGVVVPGFMAHLFAGPRA